MRTHSQGPIRREGVDLLARHPALEQPSKKLKYSKKCHRGTYKELADIWGLYFDATFIIF